MSLPDSYQDFCLKCQKCCQWEGEVYVTQRNVAEISEYLDLHEGDVIDQFMDLASTKRLVLKSRENHECIFLSPKGCQIYPVRPLQCREYPLNWNGKVEILDCPLVAQGALVTMSKERMGAIS